MLFHEFGVLVHYELANKGKVVGFDVNTSNRRILRAAANTD